MSERALFINQAAAAKAVQRLRFVMQDANFKPHYDRGALKGYTCAYQEGGVWYVVTERDVSRLGLA